MADEIIDEPVDGESTPVQDDAPIDTEVAENEVEPEAKEESPDVPETTDEETKPTWSNAEYNAASRFGFADIDDLAEKLGDDGAKEFLGRLVKAQSSMGREFSKLGQAIRTAKTEPVVKEEPTGQGETPKAGSVVDEDEWPDFGPKINQAFAAMSANHKQTQEQLARYEQQDRDRGIAEATDAVDAFVDGLDHDTYSQYGRGQTDELPEGSDHLEQRRALYKMADAQILAHEEMYGKPLPMKEALEIALNVLNPQAQVRAVTTKLGKKLTKQSAQQISRGTERRTQKAYANQDEKTKEALAEWDQRTGAGFFLDK